MKSKNIFIGTVKQCKNLYWYKQYGDERYEGDFKIGGTEIGTTHRYTDIVDTNAILIKVNEEKYIWLNLSNKKIDEFLVNFGVPLKTVHTFPTSNNLLFVDEKTLKPYFTNPKSLNVKKAKSLMKTTTI